ncbi:MAG: excinuclease ABC subunit B [Tenericutes bacterium 4572_104]|nr:MAG: excinuclease ABC subunit B [Tenericutes bacterium 4572_104]
MKKFELVSSYKPAGDQPQAIDELVAGLERGEKNQILLGVTGSGKTFTLSNVIQRVQRPVLIISPNKTLAAQLYGEFKSFFPNNAVEYFISYYDYYQPEAYKPTTDTFIDKDFSINDEIDRLRLKATSQLASGRRDVILVASVSCIYSIGKKEDFFDLIFSLHKGMRIDRQDLMRKLIKIYYVRNDYEFQRGCFRVRGDILDLIPAFENQYGLRIEFFGDEIENIYTIDALTGKKLSSSDFEVIYPAKIFVSNEAQMQKSIKAIREEMIEQAKYFRENDKPMEAQRIEQRTSYDLTMMHEVGFCSGIENYSMYLSGRKFGDRPHCIFDFFPEDYLVVLDESHVTAPQIKAMYTGDRSRKTTLVEHGFRLPSALENRPLRFDEFNNLVGQTLYMSATPGDYEMELCEGVVTEQIIRPTGLLDPEIQVRPLDTQIDDLFGEINKRIALRERVLVTTLTKKMAESLTDYLMDLNINTGYIHSDVLTIDRVEVIRQLRLGEIDVLVGVNLLREGLDLPEVSLVAVLDADKEGFLRSERSLLQVAGRTARNINGLVIFYAKKITKSMKTVIDETNRRREIQKAYNTIHGIEPETIYKSIEEILASTSVADLTKEVAKKSTEKAKGHGNATPVINPILSNLQGAEREKTIEEMYQEMRRAAENLDFETAARLRDEITELKKDD